jgi:hypothetical protein
MQSGNSHRSHLGINEPSSPIEMPSRRGFLFLVKDYILPVERGLFCRGGSLVHLAWGTDHGPGVS